MFSIMGLPSLSPFFKDGGPSFWVKDDVGVTQPIMGHGYESFPHMASLTSGVTQTGARVLDRMQQTFEQNEGADW